jgi:hypothetical protein
MQDDARECDCHQHVDFARTPTWALCQLSHATTNALLRGVRACTVHTLGCPHTYTHTHPTPQEECEDHSLARMNAFLVEGRAIGTLRSPRGASPRRRPIVGGCLSPVTVVSVQRRSSQPFSPSFDEFFEISTPLHTHYYFWSIQDNRWIHTGQHATHAMLE